MTTTQQDNEDDLVTVGYWDGVGLIDPSEIQEEKVFKIDYSKMREAEASASRGEKIMENTTYQIIDHQNGRAVSGVYKYAHRNRARNRAEKLNLEYGAHRYSAKPNFHRELDV